MTRARRATGRWSIFLYSADAWFFNHRAQFARMAGWRALPDDVEVDYWADADHVFRTLTLRSRLVQRLTAWMEARFPGTGAERVRAVTGSRR
jgi:hypothetical protein